MDKRTRPSGPHARRTRISLAVVLLAVGAAVLPAQQMDPAYVSHELAPEPTLKAGLGFPLLLNDLRTIFVSSFTYQRAEYAFGDWGFRAGSSGDREVFHTIGYTLIYIQRIGERWTLTAFAGSSLSSDFGRRLTMDDFGLTVQASIQAEVTGTFSLGGGLLYPLGAPFPYPVLLVDWDITETLGFVGYLPAYAGLQLEAGDHLDVGLAAEADFRSHHGDPDKYGVDNPRFSYITARAGPYARVNIGRWVHLQVEWGYTFLRLFTFRDGADEKESKSLEGSLAFETSLSLGL